ncbi:hypothetical protein ABZ820_11020 [Streptomyces diacarni]|uniref:DUF559 domain-containing protein n=1 Tax=Streptomyces diacarni TaxID=2800381 RepID=A0A367F6S4_9ACTN|nr:hypothetical protein [Streptomyces diacarni]RCG26063.1 hypothetical protein DTL70_08350 [Streptomyces diacarni]
MTHEVPLPPRTGLPTSEQRLHAALRYAGTDAAAPPGAASRAPHRAMITGLAALALHCFSAAPSLLDLERIDVLVPELDDSAHPGPRAPSPAACAYTSAHLVRTRILPEPEEITGLPVAPAPRALADAVAGLTDAEDVRRLLVEAVRGGHCDPQPVVRELTRARLLGLPHVADAVDSLLAEGRALTEGCLYALVFTHGLPDPCWNVELRVPGGPPVGAVDAYWPDHGVALEIDARTPRAGAEAAWDAYARKRETLEQLGVTVVHVTEAKLRDALAQQATVVRTALMTSGEREPAAYLNVLPR